MTSAETMTMPQVETEKSVAASRPFYWSLRREFWEHRSLVLAPLVVAAAIVFFAVVRLKFFAMVLAQASDQGQPGGAAVFLLAGVIVGVTSVLTGIFYALDALYGERRDRSILFWKSLPVSDRTVVLAKAAVPLLALPAITFALIAVTHLLLAVIATVGLAVFHVPVGVFWRDLPFFQMELMVLYGLAAMTLWYAPVYGWLLLMSAVAKKMPLAWAVVPIVGAIGIEKFAFRTDYVSEMVQQRLGGAISAAFALGQGPVIGLKDATPGMFLANPHLWTGLAGLAVMLVLTVRLRRLQGPI
ncbi:ABC transporter permease [Terriglobus tenax]|uniref:ABC transporter permease n=1 Tax=Terriglobus tenax TaxID=1111115 RepID=UPI0021E0B3B4|nr:ABC transporter permease [Terriglobus tenax]